MQFVNGELLAGSSDCYWIPNAVAWFWGERGDTCPLSYDLKLVNCIGSLQICSNQNRCVALTRQMLCEFAGQSGLTCTLKTSKQDDGRTCFGKDEWPSFPTENRNQFFVDNLDYLLGWVERSRDFSRKRSGFHVGTKCLNHREGDIGLEQCRSNLFHRCINIGFTESTFALEALKSGP